MKFKNLFIAALAVSATLVGCKEKEENLGTPEVSVSPTELNFDKAGTATTSNLVSLKATRDWHVNYSNDADKWVVVEPASGAGSSSAQEVSVTVLANDGFDRSATLTFDIGFGIASLVVNQEGIGSAEASIVYKNDFDATKAEKTYGSTSNPSWPYLDQFDGWKNASGTGAGAEAYAFSGLSVRSNSTSNSNYSDYSGSGDNNLFFGRDNYFAITGIALSSDVNYTLSFGSEKYSQDGDSKFSHSEFHVYVSNDGAKWVELQYEFPNGDKEGRWDLASTTFTVPSGTTTLGLYFKSDVASTYRLDDVNLSVATQAGTAIDFSTGVDLGTGGNDTPSTDYDKAEAKTVAEFIAAANTSTYYKLSGKVSSFNPKWCSFDLTDGSGTIYVYSVANKSDWSDKISNGGTVTLAGLYAYYEAKSQHEVVNAQILSFEAAGDTPSEETAKGSGTLEDPYNPKAINDIAAALASGTNSDSDYYFKGKISSIKYTFNANNYGTATFNVSEDGTTSGTQFQCYSVLYLGNRKWVDGDTQIAVGDEVVVCGKVTNYNGNTPETASQEAFIYSLNGQTSIEQGDAFGVASTALSVSATATSATIKVTGNVAWTASSDNATVSPTSGTGAGTVTVSFAENTDTENEKTYTVVVSTTADVATKSYTVTITQSKVSAAGEVTVTFNEEQLAKAACKGATVSMDDVISFTNSSDYGTNTVTQLRIYKGKILTVTAASGNITKIVFTCTANGKTKHGPGCFGTGAPEGYTFEENGKTGTWTGSAPSVAFTATDNQVRVSELSVTYVAQ